VTDAISIIEAMARPLSLLVTDIEMPGERHGLDLAWEIHERWPGTRILVVSGNRCFATERLPPGALFLAKPFGAAKLKACVQALFEGPRYGPTPAPSRQADLTGYCLTRWRKAEELCFCWLGDGRVKSPDRNLRYTPRSVSRSWLSLQRWPNRLFGACHDAAECPRSGYPSGSGPDDVAETRPGRYNCLHAGDCRPSAPLLAAAHVAEQHPFQESEPPAAKRDAIPQGALRGAAPQSPTRFQAGGGHAYG